MNISLWLDEDEEEIVEVPQKKKEITSKKTSAHKKCACGRAVCCGKHKGQCHCQNNSRQRQRG